MLGSFLSVLRILQVASKYARHCVGLWKENMTDTNYAPKIAWPGESDTRENTGAK